MKPTFLIITQVYVPDPASVGQHIADAAAEMVRRGYRTVVLTSARGYDDPTRLYPAREVRDGVEVRRLPLSSFGKGSIAIRILGQSIFLLQAIFRGLFTRGLSGVMVSTSPPFCGLAGIVIGSIRSVPVKYWLMDLNPDQMVALGLLTQSSPAVRIFDAINRAILRVASDVVVMDRFMYDRVMRKVDIAQKITILPPWPHEDRLESIPHAENPFRGQHMPGEAFVLMYSGNHSPANPLTTLLEAMLTVVDEPRLQLFCIGGGVGKREVDEKIAAGISNIRSLPYQPLDQIRFSLSAADVHVVSIGNDVVGIVHPCKVYGAMAVSRPILLLGPTPSHISDLIADYQIGWQVPHGDVKEAERILRLILNTPVENLLEMGQRAGEIIGDKLSKEYLLRQFCDILQRGLPDPAHGGYNKNY